MNKLQQEITNKIQNAQHIDGVQFGNGNSAIFKVNGKTFAAVQDASQYNIYRASVSPNGDVQLMPNGKSGKSFRTVSNFVNARS